MPIPRWIFNRTTVSNQKQTGKRRSAAPDSPQVQIPGGNGGKGKGDADAQKVAGGHGLAVLAQDADGGDVGRSPDGGQVAAQRGPGEQAEVEQLDRKSVV